MTDPLEQRLGQWARRRGVRAMFRHAPYFQRGRMRTAKDKGAWARQALQTWVVRRRDHRFKFYVYLTYTVYNPRHNGGDGIVHRVDNRRFGPFGPDTHANVQRYANATLVRAHGRYAEEVEVVVLSWRYERTNNPDMLAQARTMAEVPLRSAAPIRCAFLKYADGVAAASLEAEPQVAISPPSGECVAIALEQALLHPACNRPIKRIPHSKYDRALSPFVNEQSRRAGRTPTAPVTRDSLRALLRAVRDDVDPFCDHGYSTRVIRNLCYVFKINMVAMGKDDKVVDSVDHFEQCNHPPLVFYAFHGHMYLLATKASITGATAVAREARAGNLLHVTATHGNLQLLCEAPLATDTVLMTHEDGDAPELAPTLSGGVHLLRGVPDLRKHVIDLMSEHSLEPRIDKSTTGGVVAVSFKNDHGELVRIVADGHLCEQVDYDAMRRVAEQYQIPYSPEAAMGKMVVQLLARIARERRRFTADEYDAIVRSQGSECACGCGAVLEKAGSKWLAEFDHVLPLADGGLDTTDNLQALTIECHKEKTDAEVERGYFKTAAYASQFSGSVMKEVVMEDRMKASPFSAVQFVEARWVHKDASMVLNNHPYWSDGTRAFILQREPGGWGICVTHTAGEPAPEPVALTTTAPPPTASGLPAAFLEHLARRQQQQAATSAPGQPKPNGDHAYEDLAALHHLRFDGYEALLHSPYCPPAFANLVRRLRATGQDPAEHFELRKVDVNRCRRNALYFAKHEWPVFCPMDEVEPFDGELQCGAFYVDTNHGMPLRGCGWYSEPLLQYCVAKGYITLQDIKLQLLPSRTLPPEFFRRHIDALEAAFAGSPALQKLAVVTFVGLLARGSHELRSTYLSIDASEAAGMFLDNASGFECHVSHFGTLGDGRDVWQAEYVREMAQEKCAYPIYKQVLESGEFIELDTMRRMVEEEASGFMLEFATDAGLMLVPKCNAHVFAAPRTQLQVRTTADGGLELQGDINVPDFFWDEGHTLPRYKWEAPRPLRVSHYLGEVRQPCDPVISRPWRALETDGPSLALNGDWLPCATRLLDHGVSCNVDGAPGTGKSSLLRTLLSLAQRRHGDGSFLALAPTNVAARNLGEIGDAINTIASFHRRWQQAHEKGGKSMKRLLELMTQLRYIFVDEVSMMHSWVYGVFTSVRRNFPRIRLFLIGDYEQLAPVCDVWSGDYKNSSALHHLCDGNRLQLTECRRSDRALFDLYMNADHVHPTAFPVVERTTLHVAYTHATRKRVNAECMNAFSQNAATRVVAALEADEKSQEITLFVDLPLVCYRTRKIKSKVVFAHSEIWWVEALGDDGVTMRRKLEEVDREARKTQEDMPTLEMPYAELQSRFRPGYCITVHMSQGKTFRERYTIHDWDCERMQGRGRYVALSRGKSRDLVQIAPPPKKRSRAEESDDEFCDNDDVSDGDFDDAEDVSDGDFDDE